MILLAAVLTPLAACIPIMVSRGWRTPSIVAAAALSVSSALLLGALVAEPVEEYPLEPALDLILLEGSGFNLVFSIIISLLCALHAATSPYYLERRAKGAKPRAFYPLYLVSAGALLSTPLSGSLTTFFLFFEAYLLSSWLLLLLGGYEVGEAATRYLLFTESGALTTLLGLAVVYDEFGTFRFDRLSTLSPATRWVGSLLLLLLTAPLVKMAAVPLHLWLPDLYRVAPVPVMGLIALAEGAAAWAAVKIVQLWYRAASTEGLTLMLTALGIAMSIYGGIAALAQSGYRRLLAYSSISGSGLLLVGAARGGGVSLSSAALLFCQHALAKSALLLALGYLEVELRREVSTRFSGLASSAPRTAAATLIAFLSLAGTPPTLGFWAKLEVIAGIASDFMNAGPGGVLIVVLVSASTILTAAYSFTWFKRTFFGPPKADFNETWCAATGLALLLSSVLVALGAYPAPLLNLAA